MPPLPDYRLWTGTPDQPSSSRASDPLGLTRPIDAILLDMGGTLDGQGAWRDRFHGLFAEFGLERFSHTQRTDAFDYAEQRSHATAEMGTVGLRPMLHKHIGW